MILNKPYTFINNNNKIIIPNILNNIYKSNTIIYNNYHHVIFNCKYYATNNENEEISNRGIKREKVYKKLMTLPGRNLKKTLKLLKDNPLDELKKSKEEWQDFVNVKKSDLKLVEERTNKLFDEEAFDKEDEKLSYIFERLDQKKNEEKEEEIKKIVGEIKIKNLKTVEQMTPEQTSFDNVYMIDSLSKIQFAIHQIKKEKQIGLDIEAIEMGKQGEISLIQIAASSNASVYLFDVLSLGDTVFKYGGLKEILESKTILKVVHDCRRDSEILYHKYQVELTHVYDIQIAHAIIQKKIDGNVPIRRYGFNELTHLYTPKEYSKYCVDIKFKTKQLFEKDNKIWEKRPIPKLLVDYACLDAAVLLPIYRTLTPKLQKGSDRRFLKFHFNEQLKYFRDSVRNLYPKNLI